MKSSTARDFAPEPSEDLPDVTWKDDDLESTWGSENEDRADGCAALLTLESVRAEEPEMTRTVRSVADQVQGECAYLESRVKSPQSLARKIRSDRDKQALRVGTRGRLSSQEAAAKLNDVVRYTIVRNNHSGLTEATATTVAQLQSNGWTVKRIKSTYAEGKEYKGLHIICQTPRGQATEVQIHSAESLAAKEAAHEHYEVYRAESRSKKDRDKAKAECVRLYSTVSTPPGLDDVSAMGRRDIARVPVEKLAVSKT